MRGSLVSCRVLTDFDRPIGALGSQLFVPHSLVVSHISHGSDLLGGLNPTGIVEFALYAVVVQVSVLKAARRRILMKPRRNLHTVRLKAF